MYVIHLYLSYVHLFIFMCKKPVFTSFFTFESIKETPTILKYYPQTANKPSIIVDKPVDGVNNSEKRDSYPHLAFCRMFNAKKTDHFMENGPVLNSFTKMLWKYLQIKLHRNAIIHSG